MLLIELILSATRRCLLIPLTCAGNSAFSPSLLQEVFVIINHFWFGLHRRWIISLNVKRQICVWRHHFIYFFFYTCRSLVHFIPRQIWLLGRSTNSILFKKTFVSIDRCSFSLNSFLLLFNSLVFALLLSCSWRL